MATFTNQFMHLSLQKYNEPKRQKSPIIRMPFQQQNMSEKLMSKSNQSIIDLINGTSASQPKQHAKASQATPQGSKEHRSVPRFYVKWRAVAFTDAQSQFHGFIKDISVKGAAVFLDRNLQSSKLIKLHIHVPPAHTVKAPRIIEVYGKVVYTVYDNHELLFRAGISFLKFNSEHDPVFLETYLTNFQMRVP